MSRLAIIIAVTAALLCPPPTAAAGDARRFSVAFVNPGKTGETFWELVTTLMRAAARDLDIDLEVLSAERDRFRMRALGLSVVERATPPDYLVLVNEERFAVDVVVAASRAGIRTMLLLNDLTDEQAALVGRARRELPFLIGSLIPDNAAAGYRMARAVIEGARRIGRRGADGRFHLLAIGGDEVTPASLDRTAGMRRALAEAPDVVLDRLIHANWNEAEAELQARRYLERSGRNDAPVGVWAANDPIALGAMRAFAASGLEAGRDFAVAGLNWSPAGVAAVAERRLELTDGGHFLAGAWVLVLLRDHFDGHDFATPDPRVTFQMSPIGPERAAGYRAILDGGWDQIDFARFSAGRRPAGDGYAFGLDALLAQVREARAR